MPKEEVDWKKPMIIGGKHVNVYLYGVSMRGDHVDDLELRWSDDKNTGNVAALIRRLKPMGWEQKSDFKRFEERTPNGIQIMNSVWIGKIAALR